MVNNEDAIANGLSIKQWIDLLKGDKAKSAKTALDYYDGDQLKLMTAVLNDPHKGRSKWKQLGIIPRYRNVTKMIVDKSGLLFKDAPPKMMIYQDGSDTPDVTQSEALSNIIDQIEWQEFWNNVDKVTRLLKTSIVLQQWNPVTNSLVLSILHRGNCQVMLDATTGQIQAMIYVTSDADGFTNYRIINDLVFIDLAEINGSVSISNVSPNPYRSVPASVFYDTSTPRNGFWVHGGDDLVSLNEMVNLHLTDSEFSIAWAKRPTAVTNCKFEDGGSESYELAEIPGQPLPRQVLSAGQVIGGPSQVIMIDSTGVDSPMYDYKTPVVDIKPMDEVVSGWIKSYASDWSVRIESAGDGTASSGFQLVVEEMDNLELRKVRQRMFEAGFKRWFRILRIVTSTAGVQTFNETAQLFVEFTDPVLPVDTKQQEEVWDARIAGNRACELDYLMEVKGLSKEEALEKYLEIIEFNAQKPLLEQIALGKAEKQLGVELEKQPVENQPTQDPQSAQTSLE